MTLAHHYSIIPLYLLFASKSRVGRKVTQKAHQWCVYVRSGLGLLKERPRVREGVRAVGPTHDRSNQHVGVWVWTQVITGPGFAPYVGRVGPYRGQRAAPVVDPLWVAFTISYHVRHPHWIVP